MSLEPRLKVLLVVPFLTFWAERPICAQSAAPTPAGAKVVLKVGASLKVGEQVVDTGQSHRVYIVERTQGEWRWLVSGKIAGWARSADIIPLDEADEFYTAEITKNPHAPWPYVKRGLAYQRSRRSLLNCFSRRGRPRSSRHCLSLSSAAQLLGG